MTDYLGHIKPNQLVWVCVSLFFFGGLTHENEAFKGLVWDCMRLEPVIRMFE